MVSSFHLQIIVACKISDECGKETTGGCVSSASCTVSPEDTEEANGQNAAENDGGATAG